MPLLQALLILYHALGRVAPFSVKIKHISPPLFNFRLFLPNKGHSRIFGGKEENDSVEIRWGKKIILSLGGKNARMRGMRFTLSCSVCACFLALSSCGKKEVEPYSGKSKHWNQREVPLSLQCAACHPKEFEDWAGSDHAWAYRTVQSEMDAEPFCGGESLSAHGSTLSFSNAEGKLHLHDKESASLFDVQGVVGRTPLVQYLVQGVRGGWHTPSAAWDITKREWFDVFRDDARLKETGGDMRLRGEWGHWLGRGMNWNSQCAWCHMTGYKKNYDEKTDTYASSYKEMGVTCIQCHKLADKPDKDGCMVAAEDRKLSPKQMHDNCASCHARREEMDGDFQVGDLFDDHFLLELPLVDGVFYANGVQRDEDYCETGFRLSRMGKAGVTCLDCHDHHTGALLHPQEDNSLCLRCHLEGLEVNGTKAPVTGPNPTTPCPLGTMGARCVECHMPESYYMARDPRRDHSISLPDPALTRELGIPNVCTKCHQDKDLAWAEAAMVKTYPKEKLEHQRIRTRAVHAAMQGKGNPEDLVAAYRAEDIPAWRATLLGLMARGHISDGVRQLAHEAAKDESPMVRAAAARVLGEEALPLVKDSSKLVRRSAAWPLVDILARQGYAPETLRELKETAEFQSDQPTGAMQLATLANAQGNDAEAERQYKRAIEMDASSPVARMDYAVFLARSNRSVEALSQMLACVQASPRHAEAYYRLGLILAEVGRQEAALSALTKAVELDDSHLSARYNRALLLRQMGRNGEAEEELDACRALQAPLPSSR